MSEERLESLARKLIDLRSLRAILEELNYDYLAETVSHDKWTEREKECIDEAMIVGEKKDYKIFYLRTTRDTVDICRKIASKISDETQGLCIVCSQSATGRNWLFSTQAKRHKAVFADTKHVPVAIMPDIGVKKEFIKFLSDIRIPKKSERAVTTTEIMVMVSNALDRFQIPVNELATKKMGAIYDHLVESEYNPKHIEKLLTRILYCLFAEDTTIFDNDPTFRTDPDDKKSVFRKWLIRNTKSDGSDLGENMVALFGVLNTHKNERKKCPDDLSDFPYINGGLFEDKIDTPKLNKKTRDILIDASKFNWSDISPSIFGSLFQNIMDELKRRELGAHYTTEENILKVIRPLFLDDLYKQFNDILSKNSKLSTKKNQLEKFQEKLSKLTFFDPACGAGNFLIITYRELRRLELSLIMVLHDNQTKVLDVSKLSKINVDQFYGIEKETFSAKIAETALWMMDHLMNLELADYGMTFARIPLKKHPNITNGDALELDWNEIISNDRCSYILGNPPFSGFKEMDDDQKENCKKITGFGNMDYVTSWFVKAVDYGNDKTRIGLVATNSIVQGKQADDLFPLIFEKKFEIEFAYSSFKWTSDTSNAAKTTVIILGLSKDKSKTKRFFSDGVESNPKHISHKLTAESKKVKIIKGERNPINNFPSIIRGIKPIDNERDEVKQTKLVKDNLISEKFVKMKQYVFKKEEKKDFISKEPGSEKFFKKYVSGNELLRNTHSWILDLEDADPEELSTLTMTQERIENVRIIRENSTRDQTKIMAEQPRSFAEGNMPTETYLAIPLVFSEKYAYIPMKYVEPEYVPSDSILVIENANLELFGLLSSTMMRTWIKFYGGKLENRFRYTADRHNTFPPPSDYSSLKGYAKKIISVRGNKKLSAIYKRNLMPEELFDAHVKLDKAVDRLYRKEPFSTEKERLDFLRQKHEEMIQK